MRISILELREGESFLEFQETPDSLEMGALSSALNSRIPVKLWLHKHDNEIVVRGAASVTITEECSRCLESYDRKFDVQFEVFCDKMGARGDGQEAREAEGETFTAFHDGRTLELGPCLREAIVLSLPIKPLCKEACKGLCPVCGKNLNEGPCDCLKDKIDARWSLLDGLKKREEEN